MSVTLINTFRAKEGQGDELREMFKTWEGGISAAPGCRDLRVFVDPDAADVVLSIEEWDSRESHQSFVDSISEEAMAAAYTVLTGPPEVKYYDPA